MIGLVDCNNFYVSCERVFQPRLEGLPVGVLSNNDGCVIARSSELRALGVAMGTPAFELKGLLRQGRIRLLSSNYELYGDMSARVQAVLEEFSAGVEPYSIDEMFVRFDGFEQKQLLSHCRELHYKVRRFTGIPVSVGVAPTQTLAKLANRAAKKVPGYRGVCVLSAGSVEMAGLLQRTELSEVWGVGRRLVERLALMDIRTAWDLAQADPKAIRRRFSVTLERTALELRGVPCTEMNDTDEPRQRIMTSRSFGRLTDNRDEIHEALRQFGQRGAEKLRTQDSLARAVYVFLKTNRHRQDLPQYSPGAVVELARPTDDSREILHAVGQAFAAIYRPHYRFMKAGVMLIDLIDANRQQMSLLESPQSAAERERSEKLMATLDALNQRMGRGTIKLGMPSPSAAWHLRCANRSPRWTTRWKELPTITAPREARSVEGHPPPGD
ncbi:MULTISPECIES: Y-family DNA polymerase [unclassified Halomonas]|uniref:Y-family DNA polymerase n=1 Tax=unclassified Halomonas TaxID=2609666 RepID=UPI00288559B5|nr:MULTISPECIES: Y-family DNA polymerase [unclassified Halomonas]MDT0501126.1 Y-family DNA polymerase [Halomonas sp. PAR7]MDT0513317.1 Y-family DNA polymerase [Halomonas sp. LES1]MDT0592170.1 Y-family DNA polymerase [Halomonas sp. PAR8]